MNAFNEFEKKVSEFAQALINKISVNYPGTTCNVNRTSPLEYVVTLTQQNGKSEAYSINFNGGEPTWVPVYGL